MFQTISQYVYIHIVFFCVCVCVFNFIYTYMCVYIYKWVNDNISLTWILRPYWDDFPNPNHHSQGSVATRGRDEVYPYIYIYYYIYNYIYIYIYYIYIYIMCAFQSPCLIVKTRYFSMEQQQKTTDPSRPDRSPSRAVPLASSRPRWLRWCPGTQAVTSGDDRGWTTTHNGGLMVV